MLKPQVREYSILFKQEGLISVVISLFQAAIGEICHEYGRTFS